MRKIKQYSEVRFKYKIEYRHINSGFTNIYNLIIMVPTPNLTVTINAPPTLADLCLFDLIVQLSVSWNKCSVKAINSTIKYPNYIYIVIYYRISKNHHFYTIYIAQLLFCKFVQIWVYNNECILFNLLLETRFASSKRGGP